MKKTMNFIRGNVTVEVRGRFPERFMNICAENEVEFWELSRIDEEMLRVRMHISGYNKLRELDAPFEISLVKKTGVPFFVKKFKKRYVLIIALILCAAAVWMMSLYIWRIEVKGNVNVPTERILTELDSIGVGLGTKASKIDPYVVRNSMLLRIDELLWMTVNVNGSYAEVIVRERLVIPDIVDIKQPADVVAKKAGLITDVRVLSGERRVEVGQTIMEGELIASGTLTNTMQQQRYVHAMAEVYARTWYTLKASMPLEYGEKLYTGDETVKRSLLLGNKRINLYFSGGISFVKYDKIMNVGTGDVFGIMTLPVRIVTETYREYETALSTMAEDKAEQMLKTSLMDELIAETDGGNILATNFDFTVKDGVMTATLYAECHEQIAQTVRIEQPGA